MAQQSIGPDAGAWEGTEGMDFNCTQFADSVMTRHLQDEKEMYLSGDLLFTVVLFVHLCTVLCILHY